MFEQSITPHLSKVFTGAIRLQKAVLTWYNPILLWFLFYSSLSAFRMHFSSTEAEPYSPKETHHNNSQELDTVKRDKVASTPTSKESSLTPTDFWTLSFFFPILKSTTLHSFAKVIRFGSKKNTRSCCHNQCLKSTSFFKPCWLRQGIKRRSKKSHLSFFKAAQQSMERYNSSTLGKQSMKSSLRTLGYFAKRCSALSQKRFLHAVL